MTCPHWDWVRNSFTECRVAFLLEGFYNYPQQQAAGRTVDSKELSGESEFILIPTTLAVIRS